MEYQKKFGPGQECRCGCGSEKCLIFRALSMIRRDSRIGPAVRDCFSWLWHHAGGHPNYIVVTTKWIAYDFGVERRAVEKWINSLVKFSLIEIIDRDKKSGTIRLYIFHPLPEKREPRPPDPQKTFDFQVSIEARKGPGELDEVSIEARKGPGELDEASIEARKGPGTDNISARPRCVDEDEDKLILFIKSVSWEQIAHLFFKVWRTIYHRNAGILKEDPAEEDRELILSACVLSLALKAGDKWLKYSAVAVRSLGDRARIPIRLFRTCLIEKMVGYLGIGTVAESNAQFGRLLTIVRPKVNELWRSLDEELKIRKSNQTAR